MTSAEKLADYQAAVAAVREAELPRDSASWQRMMVDPNIKMGEAGGNCPVQIKLEVDDHSAYFRARGTHWSFEVAKPEFFAPCARESTIFHIERFYGEWPSAGWMTMIEASDFLEQAIAEFRSRTPAATSNSTD